jgi:hypothetical protein
VAAIAGGGAVGHLPRLGDLAVVVERRERGLDVVAVEGVEHAPHQLDAVDIARPVSPVTAQAAAGESRRAVGTRAYGLGSADGR